MPKKSPSPPGGGAPGGGAPRGAQPPGTRRRGYWRVKLPAGVGQPFEVYVNGVRQELGADYRIAAGELLFERELVSQKLGLWAWLIGFWGIGTYKRNDEVDVRYELQGRPMLAHALEIIPPS